MKHTPTGRFRLSWLWGAYSLRDQFGKVAETGFEWKYWANYNELADAKEWLESYVKPGWPNVKWEIKDTITDEVLESANPTDTL